jgi:hypothetical protein
MKYESITIRKAVQLIDDRQPAYQLPQLPQQHRRLYSQRPQICVVRRLQLEEDDG